MRILPFQATGSATFAVKHISLGLIKRWMAVVVYLLNFSEIFSYLINWVGGNTPLHLERILICRHVILRRKKSLVLYQPNYLVFDSYKLHIFIDNFKLSNWYIKVILDQEFGLWLMKKNKFLNNSVKWFLKDIPYVSKVWDSLRICICTCIFVISNHYLFLHVFANCMVYSKILDKEYHKIIFF